MYAEFAAELGRDDGRTYPQELPMSRSEFEAYFFARDVIVGIGEERAGDEADGTVLDGARGVNALLAAKGDRTWTDVVAGFYYVRSIFDFRHSREMKARLTEVDRLSRIILGIPRTYVMGYVCMYPTRRIC